MATNYAPGLSREDFLCCLAKAQAATNPEELQRLRTSVLRRWWSDAKADNLVAALYAHQERLAAREHTRRLAHNPITQRRSMRPAH